MLFLALAVLASGLAFPVSSAEFDLNDPLPKLRRLQPCTACGAALVVTAFRPGEQVRCALCEQVEPRLADAKTLTLMYQGCPFCDAQLDATGCVSGQEVRCGSCQSLQKALPAVVDFANRPERRAERARFVAQLQAYTANARPSARAPDAATLSPSPVPAAVDASQPNRTLLRPSTTEAPPPGFADEYRAHAPDFSAPGVKDLFRSPSRATPNDRRMPPRTLPDEPPGPASSVAIPSAASSSPNRPLNAATPPPSIPRPETVAVARHPEGVSAEPPGWKVLPVAPPDRSPETPNTAGGVRTAPAVTVSDFFGGGGNKPIAAANRDAPAQPALSSSSSPERNEPGAGATSLALTPMAYVNGQPILRRDVDEAVGERMRRIRAELGARIRTPEGEAALTRRETTERSEALKNLIDRAVALQAAARTGLEPPEAVVRERWDELRRTNMPGDLRTQARNDTTMAYLLKHFAKEATVTPEQVRREYDRRKPEFATPERWDVRAAVIYKDRTGRTDPRPAAAIAKEAEERLAAGESFATVATRYNEGPADPSTGEARPVTMYDDAIRRAFADAPAGKAMVTGPVEQEYWVSFLKLAAKEAAGVRPFTEVSEELRRQMMAEAGMKMFREWLDRQREQAEIRVTSP